MIKKEWILKTPRIYGIRQPVVAITGGIATGKSFVGKLIEKKKLPFISADREIKKIYREEKVLDIIRKLTPECLQESRILFPLLRKKYFENPRLKKELNEYLYPKLEENIRNFTYEIPQSQEIYYEVPLLFENKLEDLVDIILLVYTDEKTQIERIKKRDGSSAETIKQILNNQIPLSVKKEKAHFLMNSNAHIEKSLDAILKKIQT